jgi:hypothetical protein
MLGFRGHFVTKSRGYSTTLGELRAVRAAYRARQAKPPDDAEVNDDDSTVVLSVWQYLGSGYLNPGDVLLAAGVEASVRAAREALLDLRRGPRDQRQPDGLTSGLLPRRSEIRGAWLLRFLQAGDTPNPQCPFLDPCWDAATIGQALARP